MKYLLSTVAGVVLLTGLCGVFSMHASAQGISQLQQFTSTTTPSSSITQTTWGKALKITGLITGRCLTLDANSLLTTAACASYSFPLSGNATSTLTQFNGGLTSYASTTIGAGTQAGGLTISGGATTTGNALFQGTTNTFNGNVGIGQLNPTAKLWVNGSSLFANQGNVEITLDSAGANYGQIYNNSTGLWSLGYGTSLSSIGTSVISWTSGGLVGIGSTTPWAQLSVNPNNIGTGPAFAVGSSTKTDFVVTNAGRVGVGTAAPANTFVVRAAAPTASLEASGYTHNFNNSALTRANQVGAWTPWSGSTGGNALVGIASGPTPSFAFLGATNDTSPTVSTIWFIALKRSGGDTTALASTEKAFSFFNGAPGFNNGSEILTILGGGTVGIGTSTPTSASKLVVSNQPLGNGTVATTTVDFGDYATTTSIACFNTKNTAGTAVSFFFVGTSIVVESGRCK